MHAVRWSPLLVKLPLLVVELLLLLFELLLQEEKAVWLPLLVLLLLCR